jgi:hypothetical protein
MNEIAGLTFAIGVMVPRDRRRGNGRASGR